MQLSLSVSIPNRLEPRPQLGQRLRVRDRLEQVLVGGASVRRRASPDAQKRLATPTSGLVFQGSNIRQGGRCLIVRWKSTRSEDEKGKPQGARTVDAVSVRPSASGRPSRTAAGVDDLAALKDLGGEKAAGT
jgi:hypothetical protein